MVVEGDRVSRNLNRSEVSVAMTWWAIPLAAVVSLVWNTSRFEETRCILARSVRMFLTLMVFMGLIGGALFLLSYHL